MVLTVVIICIYLSSAVASAGFNLAYFSGLYPNISEYREDLGHAIMWGLLVGALGPLGVLVTFLLSGLGKYGWTLLDRKKNHPCLRPAASISTLSVNSERPVPEFFKNH